MEALCLTQHITQQMHSQGNILDLELNSKIYIIGITEISQKEISITDPLCTIRSNNVKDTGKQKEHQAIVQK